MGNYIKFWPAKELVPFIIIGAICAIVAVMPAAAWIAGAMNTLLKRWWG
jgi:hypothetical protein